MLLRDASFIVVDVETTGLSAISHRITEIGMVRVLPAAKGWETSGTFQTLINPEQFIPPFITQHTGITNAMVYGKPKFREALPEIRQFLAGMPVMVGHNVSFDRGFLAESFERGGESLAFGAVAGGGDFLCTCKLSRRMLPKLKRHSLKHVQDYFGIRNRRQHRALGDAEATAAVLLHFLEMAADMEIETLDDLLRLQYARPNYTRRPKTKKQVSLREAVRGFPERPGVYTMYGPRGEVLYIGKAKNLRDRVSSYFSVANVQGTKLAQLMKVARDIQYEETGSELSALLLESRRIKEHSPRFNSLERRYKSQAFLRLDIHHPFPKLTCVRQPGQDGAEYYGPFRSRDSVDALIDVLNRSFSLRECADQFSIGPHVKPCFYHAIHRCSGPCAELVTAEVYRLEVDRLRTFLAAGEEGILALIEAMMRRAADRLDFEEAQFLKVRLLELRRVLGGGERVLASLNANNLVILHRVRTGPTGGRLKGNGTTGDGSSGIECEALFVHFGKLVKQVVISREKYPQFFQETPAGAPEEWFYRQLRLYYTATPATAPTAGKPEIDEMRILSRWLEQHRKKESGVVYIEQDWEDAVGRLARKLRELLGTARDVRADLAAADMAGGGAGPIEMESLPLPLEAGLTNSLPPVTSPRERRLVLRPMKA